MSGHSSGSGGSGNPGHTVANKSAEIHALNRHLVSARDEQILKVVAMVDFLPQRGEADALIAPLRSRLAELRPRRPLLFGRLLCLPLNPLLVNGPKWRRGSPNVPRTALACFIRQVEELAPDLAAEVARELAGGTTDDPHLILRVGVTLWGPAAGVLAAAKLPPDWEAATGLAPADHAAIRRTIVLVLGHAEAIAGQVASSEPNAEVIGKILRQVAADSPDQLTALIGVLLHWAPAAAPLVLAITSAHDAPGGVAGRAASERAVEMMLDDIAGAEEASVDGPLGLPRLRRTITLLDELAEHSHDRPGRAARIVAARARVDAACRVRFEDVLRNEMLPGLVAANDAAAASGDAAQLPEAAAEATRLETVARHLRNFEHVARRVSRTDHYDRLLRGVADILAPRAGEGASARIDKVRLAEILLGPEKALAMMAGPTNEAATVRLAP